MDWSVDILIGSDHYWDLITERYFDGVGIQWRFNIPRAPWWGGVFERLVRFTKRCLRKILGQAKFTYDELLTALVEIEMVLNSRPLTYISADDLEEPLTPSHLLIGRRLMNFPDHLLAANQEIESDDEDCRLNAHLKYLNQSLDSFWRRWRREYLSGGSSYVRGGSNEPPFF